MSWAAVNAERKEKETPKAPPTPKAPSGSGAIGRRIAGYGK